MKKKLITMFLILAFACTGLIACGNGGEEVANKDTENQEETFEGTQEIKVWTSYGAQGAGLVTDIAEEFNAMQDDYEVTVEYGGNALTIRQKIATSKTKYYPSILFGQNNAIYEYATAEYVAPIQDFIDKDEDKWTDDMYENVKRSYSDEKGNMIGAPMGVSAKGYLVNLDILSAAGYTVEDITSFEKVAEIATAAHDKGLCKYGYVINGGTDLLDMMTYQGVDIFDADNGYSGDITKCLYDVKGETKDALTKITKILADMHDKGVAYPNADGAGGGSKVFINEQVVFWSCTNSDIDQLFDVDLGFEWSFIPLTGIDENAKFKGEVLSEGTGMFIANTGNEREMQGAYEFIKFVAEAENQIYFCESTGYVPYTSEASNNEEWITWSAEEFPGADALAKRMQSAPKDLKFPYSKLTNQLLTANSELISNIMNDPKGDVNGYVTEAANSLNKSIKMMNLGGK